MTIERQHEFDQSAYSITAIRRAAFRYSSSCSARISKVDSTWRVELFPIEGQTQRAPTQDEFASAVLDEALREQIVAETSSVRDQLIRQAFAAMRSEPAGG